MVIELSPDKTISESSCLFKIGEKLQFKPKKWEPIDNNFITTSLHTPTLEKVIFYFLNMLPSELDVYSLVKRFGTNASVPAARFLPLSRINLQDGFLKEDTQVLGGNLLSLKRQLSEMKANALNLPLMTNLLKPIPTVTLNEKVQSLNP